MQIVLSKNACKMFVIASLLVFSLTSCVKDLTTNKTVTLQQQGTTTLHLAYLSHGGDITSQNSPEISAEAWTVGGDPVFLRGLVKFDLSQIPPTAKIISAHLTLYSDPNPTNGDLVHANAGTNNTMLLQRVTSPWDLGTRWQTQPTTDASTQIVVPHTDLPILNLLIDVKQMVQTMVSTYNNYGWMIKLQNETYYNSRIFLSNNSGDASKWPKLEVVYRLF